MTKETNLTNLEQRADVDIEAKVSKSSSDNFSATIMTVLSHLGDQDARTTSF